MNASTTPLRHHSLYCASSFTICALDRVAGTISERSKMIAAGDARLVLEMNDLLWSANSNFERNCNDCQDLLTAIESLR